MNERDVTFCSVILISNVVVTDVPRLSRSEQAERGAPPAHVKRSVHIH
jgi:hypothetical protein